MSASYPGLRDHDDRIAFIAKDHWRQFESPSEHAERVASAQESAGWYFDQATRPQKADYKRAVAALSNLQGLSHDRALEAANRAWYASTAKARDVFERTFEDLMRDGEVSEETGALWDALPSHIEAANAVVSCAA
jgi:hypothetical protein